MNEQYDDTEDEDVSLDALGIDGIDEVDLELEDVGTPVAIEADKGRKVEDEDEEDSDEEEQPRHRTKHSKKDEVDSDAEEAELSEEERRKMGKRAQKRIQNLVRKRKEVETELDEVRAERDKLRKERAELASNSKTQEMQTLEQHERRVAAEEQDLINKLKAAKLEGDIDAEVEITDHLTQVKADKMLITRAKEHFASQADDDDGEGGTEVDTPEPRSGPQAQPSEAALDWQERNEWFDANSQDPTAQRLMAQAGRIHNELISEGYIPYPDDDEAVSEYFEVLDERLQPYLAKTKFAQETGETPKPPQRGQSPVAGGTRTSGAGRKKSTTSVKLNPRQQAYCKRNGISEESYARELARIKARG